MGWNGHYFLNDTGMTIEELYNKAKRKWSHPHMPILTSRLVETEYDRTTGKWKKMRLATFAEITGWLSDEDLMEISPEEQIFVSDERQPEKRIRRIGDMQFYQAAVKRARAAGKKTDSDKFHDALFAN
jgi:hypothetical protein